MHNSAMNKTYPQETIAAIATAPGRGGVGVVRVSGVGLQSLIGGLTGRELQRRHGQWFKGKSLDRSCPMGPVIVPREEAVPSGP